MIFLLKLKSTVGSYLNSLVCLKKAVALSHHRSLNGHVSGNRVPIWALWVLVHG